MPRARSSPPPRMPQPRQLPTRHPRLGAKPPSVHPSAAPLNGTGGCLKRHEQVCVCTQASIHAGNDRHTARDGVVGVGRWRHACVCRSVCWHRAVRTEARAIHASLRGNTMGLRCAAAAGDAQIPAEDAPGAGTQRWNAVLPGTRARGPGSRCLPLGRCCVVVVMGRAYLGRPRHTHARARQKHKAPPAAPRVAALREAGHGPRGVHGELHWGNGPRRARSGRALAQARPALRHNLLARSHIQRRARPGAPPACHHARRRDGGARLCPRQGPNGPDAPRRSDADAHTHVQSYCSIARPPPPPGLGSWYRQQRIKGGARAGGAKRGVAGEGAARASRRGSKTRTLAEAPAPPLADGQQAVPALTSRAVLADAVSAGTRVASHRRRRRGAQPPPRRRAGVGHVRPRQCAMLGRPASAQCQRGRTEFTHRQRQAHGHGRACNCQAVLRECAQIGRAHV